MTANFSRRNDSSFAPVLIAGLLVGTIDICAAIGLTLIRGGNPIRLLQFIASGVFGTAAFGEGWFYVVSGLVLHYGIAMIWTVIFFQIGRAKPGIYHHKVLTGICYGILVWIIMNLIVLPLSRTPVLPFSYWQALIGAVVLVMAIGIPLAFLSAPRLQNDKVSR